VPWQDHLGKAGGGVMATAFASAIGYLITSHAPGQPSPHLTWPLWPYYLCGAMFAVGLLLYGEAHKLRFPTPSAAGHTGAAIVRAAWRDRGKRSIQPAASRTPDDADASDVRAVAAQTRFLAALRPNIECANNGGYDVAEVNRYLSTARSLAVRDMTELRAFLAVTPRNFKWRRRNAYSQHDVRIFMRALDAGVTRYFADISPALYDVSELTLSADAVQREMSVARSKYIEALRPEFDRVGFGYGVAEVDRYVNAARSAADRDTAGSIRESQAYLAMTPRSFDDDKRNGYAKWDVDGYFEGVARAAEEYARRISLLLHKGPREASP